jgi:hypothetical protein
MLLLEPRTGVGDREGRDEAKGKVVFLVHRAADGWLGLELTGAVTQRFRPTEAGEDREIEVVRGGNAFDDRIVALYHLDFDPESLGGLRVPGTAGARFGFGGDLTSLLRAVRSKTGACTGAREHLRLFRGMTALSPRSRSVPEGARVVRATPELVFEVPAEILWLEASRADVQNRQPAAVSSARRRSRWDMPRDRGATLGSARGRTG